MIAHFINPYLINELKYFNILLIEDDTESSNYNEIIFRGEISFNYDAQDYVFENEAKRILSEVDENKIINKVIIDKPESWQF